MRYFSMFSGIGTGEKGIKQAFSNTQLRDEGGATSLLPRHDQSMSFGKSDKRQSATCVGFSEIDRHAEAIYKYHYPEHSNYGDATGIICDELPDFDFLIGGFPCQAFSIAGKRQGFDDARGTLFFEIARILSHKRPAHFLLENVRGLLSHDDGKTVHEIFRILTELDYRVELCVLNSKDYGVPQNRERCFFIGHLRERCSREILSVGDGDGEPFTEPDGSGNDVAHTITNGDKQRGSYDIASTDELAWALDANYYKGSGAVEKARRTVIDGSTGQKVSVGTLRTHKDGNGFREVQSGNCPTIPARAREDGSGQPVIAVASRGRPRDGRNEQQLEPRFDGLTNTITSVEKDNLVMAIGGLQEHQHWRNDGLSPTLTQAMGTGGGQTPLVGKCNSRIRRLTPRECERLQGLPDNYTTFGRYGDEIKEVSDTQRYKGLGNSFTVNVIEAIITRMLEKGCIE